MENIKLIATDLDGTFLKNDQSISQNNLNALAMLGEKGIVRVAATGRNLKKVEQVIAAEVPFDYIVFSSGAGVYCWKEKKHVYAQNMAAHSTKKISDFFVNEKLNFHVFCPVPDNHKHYYYRGKKKCEEFERYFEFNKSEAEELVPGTLGEGEMCQYLLIIKEDEQHFNYLKNEIEKRCTDIRVIRASSPITKGYIWIEIFYKTVSKGNGVNEICKLRGIKQDETMGLGNDYNDFDLLEFTNYSFLTENSPEQIKTHYPLVPSNENDAFAESVKDILR